MNYNENSISQKWINGEISESTIDWCKKFGEFLASKRDGKKDSELKTNQLRKFFGDVKRMQAKGFIPSEFILLKPQLAYAVGKTRNRENKIKEFYAVMSGAISKVQSAQQFDNFIKIFEAIVAYHKAYEENSELM